nr:hypothetical protein [Sicyoidochytrium minutum DNA virus]
MEREEELSRFMRARQFVVTHKIGFVIAFIGFFGVITFIITAVLTGLFDNDDTGNTPTPSPSPTPGPTPSPTPAPSPGYNDIVSGYRFTQDQMIAMGTTIGALTFFGFILAFTGVALGTFGFRILFWGGVVLGTITICMAAFGINQGWPFRRASKDYSSFIDKNESTRQFASIGCTVLLTMSAAFWGFAIFLLLGAGIQYLFSNEGRALIRAFRGRLPTLGSVAARIPSRADIARRGRNFLSFFPYVKSASLIEAERKVAALDVPWINEAIAGRRLTRAQYDYIVRWAGSRSGRLDTAEAQASFFMPAYNPNEPADNVEVMALVSELYPDLDPEIKRDVDTNAMGFTFQDNFYAAWASLPAKRRKALTKKKERVNEEYRQATGNLSFGEDFNAKGSFLNEQEEEGEPRTGEGRGQRLRRFAGRMRPRNPFGRRNVGAASTGSEEIEGEPEGVLESSR